MTTYQMTPLRMTPLRTLHLVRCAMHTEAIVSAHVRVTYAQCIYLASTKDNAKDR